MGRQDEAGEQLQRALELEPEGLNYLHAYADYLLRRSRLDEALGIAERMITQHPDQPIGRQMKAAIQDAQR
jgi:predicted Zn-dependent protease